MIIDPIPPVIYKRFAQTMAIFNEYLAGTTKVALAAKHGISMGMLETAGERLGNYAYACWEQAGMPEPKCLPRYHDEDGTPRHYFSTFSEMRKEKAFWLAQLERMQLLYDAQAHQKEKDEMSANISDLDLCTRTLSTLQSYQVKTIEQLEKLKVTDFRRMSGMGIIGQREIREALCKYRGLNLPEVTEINAIKDAGCFVGTLANGELDITGTGNNKTVQLEGSFTKAQLECLIGYMKNKE